jgi:hypothetical protein
MAASFRTATLQGLPFAATSKSVLPFFGIRCGA